VLLPVRDAAGTLRACLRSLAAQTLADYELLAVDDGSRDGSLELLRRAADRDSRLRVIAGEARGLVSALNIGLFAARAPLLARMDADDLARSDRLRLQAARLETEGDLVVLGCGVELRGGGNNAGMRRYVEWSNGLLDHEAIARDLFVESPFVHPSVMARTEALRALGGYRDFDGPEDYDLWLRAHTAGLRFAKLEERLLVWRDSPARLTRRDPRYRADRFLALKVASLVRGPLAGRPDVVIWGAGPIGKSWARALRSRGYVVRAFVEVDPAKIGQRVHGAPVVPVEEAPLLHGPLHVAAVGQPGARARIRAEAERLGLVEGRDLVAVA
jgi:glycosyltransferase involved in cell wall biosynthesis